MDPVESSLQWPSSGGDVPTLPVHALPGIDPSCVPVDPAAVAQLLGERRTNPASAGTMPGKIVTTTYPGGTPMAATPGPAAASLPRWASEAGPWGMQGWGRGASQVQREAPPSMEEQMAMDGLITSRVPQR